MSSARLESIGGTLPKHPDMAKKPVSTAFGKRLRSLRREAELSQAQLANKVGVNHMTVNRWERGHWWPGSDTLIRIADVLGVDIGSLTAPANQSRSLEERVADLESEMAALDEVVAKLRRRWLDVAQESGHRPRLGRR